MSLASITSTKNGTLVQITVSRISVKHKNIVQLSQKKQQQKKKKKHNTWFPNGNWELLKFFGDQNSWI